MTKMYLHTLGRTPYQSLAPALNGTTAAWADIDGWHIADPPTNAPTATHLWAWSGDTAIRLRIDGQDAVGAALNDSPQHPAAIKSEEVTVRIDTHMNWEDGEKRLRSSLAPYLDTAAELITVISDPSVTFVRQPFDGTAG